MLIGVNPNQATAKGLHTVGVADDFTTLDRDFGNLIDEATAAAGEPEVTRGFGEYQGMWTGAMRAVGHHGGQVGTNTATGAGLSVTTDTGIKAKYQVVGASVPALNATG